MARLNQSVTQIQSHSDSPRVFRNSALYLQGLHWNNGHFRGDDEGRRIGLFGHQCKIMDSNCGPIFTLIDEGRRIGLFGHQCKIMDSNCGPIFTLIEYYSIGFAILPGIAGCLALGLKYFPGCWLKFIRIKMTYISTSLKIK